MEKLMFEEKYDQKMTQLRNQIKLILEGEDLKLKESIKHLEEKYHERVSLKTDIHKKRCKDIEHEYKKMRETAFKEYEEKKISLKQNLMKQLEEDRKLAIQECQSLELNQESVDVKPVCTRRILRRRAANELPYNGSDVKRKKQPTPDIKFHLDDKDIEEDVNTFKTLIAPEDVKISTSTISSDKKHVATIQDGKLLYDKRYYYRGQSIFVESSNDEERYAAIIQAVEINKICLRKLTDNSRISIMLSHLHNGTYRFRKRIFN